MKFKQFYLGCLAHASYYIGSEGEAAIIDPQRDVQQYLDEATANGQKIKYIIETHSHADFVSGHLELAEKTGLQVGIDAGIESFMTLSNGEQIENFKYFESAEKKLRRKQRSVAGKKKGSKSRKDAVINLRKTHEKIKNQRNDFAHKVSTKLVKEFDVIAIENLNILGMSKGILAKQILNHFAPLFDAGNNQENQVPYCSYGIKYGECRESYV